MIDFPGVVPSTSPSDAPDVAPLASSTPHVRSSSTLSPVICDERVISKLLESLLYRSGQSSGEVARKMGVSPNSVRQYINGRRCRPSLIWFVRLAELCGARVIVEFPPSRY